MANLTPTMVVTSEALKTSRTIGPTIGFRVNTMENSDTLLTQLYITGADVRKPARSARSLDVRYKLD